MKTLLFLFLLLTLSCATPRQMTAIKPFKIIEKTYVYSEVRLARYVFIDSNGVEWEQYWDSDLYEIGQIINDEP